MALAKLKKILFFQENKTQGLAHGQTPVVGSGGSKQPQSSDTNWIETSDRRHVEGHHCKATNILPDPL